MLDRFGQAEHPFESIFERSREGSSSSTGPISEFLINTTSTGSMEGLPEWLVFPPTSMHE